MHYYNAAMSKPFQFSMRRMVVAADSLVSPRHCSPPCRGRVTALESGRIPWRLGCPWGNLRPAACRCDIGTGSRGNCGGIRLTMAADAAPHSQNFRGSGSPASVNRTAPFVSGVRGVAHRPPLHRPVWRTGR